ncbi:MAG TPA: Ig-like domain repeat protein [Acidimicrobiales bacterium]|nr:Ig-like domain repeat protein [Acidimicrobiales bacterium]
MEGTGTLQIHDADEPYALTAPTEFAGEVDDQTGVISDGTFSTPTVSFEQEITTPLRATVFIDATFSEVTPGTVTGSVDPDGNLLLQASLTVDLDIEVIPTGETQPLPFPGECRTTPVSLTLDSTVPYGPAGPDGRVTMADPDFTVPPVVATPQCDSTLVEPVNEQLAGSGHALAMTLQGDIPLPPDAPCETTTALAVSPVEGSRVGDEVTLTATVSVDEPRDPECAAESAGVDLSGSVDFTNGSTTLGNATLAPDGTATLATSALPAGVRHLAAEYRGTPPYARSTSERTEYLVAAAPLISANLPERIQIGASPVEFDLSITNTGLGAALDGARLDVTLRRPVGTGAFTPDRVVLEHFDGQAWQPVALSVGATRVVIGSVGDSVDVAPGATVSRRLRIAFGAPGGPAVDPGPVTVAFEVVDGTAAPMIAPTPGALARSTSETVMVEATRRTTTVTFGSVPVTPHTVRQGNTLTISANVGPTVGNVRPSGLVRVLLDGRPVDFTRPGGMLILGFEPELTLTRSTAVGTLLVRLPVDVPIGTRQLTVQYSGDDLFLPTQGTVPFTVLPAVGTIYECIAPGGAPDVGFRANVVAQANLPSARPVGQVDLDHLDVRILTDRSFSSTNGFSGLLPNETVSPVGVENLEGVEMAIGPGGSGTATAVERRFGTTIPATPNPATVDVDQVVSFHGETGSFPLAGAPGEVVPVTLDSVVIRTRTDALGLPYVFTCLPVGEPVLLGRVTVAGATLAVSPEASARAGSEVTLAAAVAPATSGTVEFLDGSETIGVAPVVDGEAVLSTVDLPVGAHSLSARFFGGTLVPPLVTDVVPFTVLPEFECEAFTEPGSGAVVRLVYLELLGRCPDQGGYDHWTGRLDGGTSPEAFARSMARTPEAVGRVVDDAYETMLGRPADAGGRAFWTARLLADGRYERLLADLAASPEFASLAGGTDAGFVTRVYERLLNRAPDAAGLEFWTARLAAGTSPRALVRTLATLDEPLRVLVAAAYDEILGRAPSSAERSDGVRFLRATGDRSGLYAELMGRPEFDDRAQGLPNPED